MIDTKEFVRELKRYGVKWNEKEHQHLIGNDLLTNKDMRIMCSNRYGNEYIKLTNGEQRKIRENIFRKIRYGEYDG
jgi:hypothetical protein